MFSPAWVHENKVCTHSQVRLLSVGVEQGSPLKSLLNRGESFPRIDFESTVFLCLLHLMPTLFLHLSFLQAVELVLNSDSFPNSIKSLWI